MQITCSHGMVINCAASASRILKKYDVIPKKSKKKKRFSTSRSGDFFFSVELKGIKKFR